MLSLLVSLLALPLGIMVMQRYLEDFYYAIDFPWWVLLVSVALTLFIAFVSVIWHTLSVARRNPVDSIRTE